MVTLCRSAREAEAVLDVLCADEIWLCLTEDDCVVCEGSCCAVYDDWGPFEACKVGVVVLVFRVLEPLMMLAMEIDCLVVCLRFC